jgi:hypothetical protein
LGQRALEEDVIDMLYVATQSTFSIGRTQSSKNLIIEGSRPLASCQVKIFIFRG